MIYEIARADALAKRSSGKHRNGRWPDYEVCRGECYWVAVRIDRHRTFRADVELNAFVCADLVPSAMGTLPERS